MIPRIIHQTWKTETLPDKAAPFAESWGRFNPSWRRILWTDRMLLSFVAEHYPHLLELYMRYPREVCRADAGRYMLLHTFGGVYADIDVECLASFDVLENETRLVLCQEPPAHWQFHAPYRGHPYVLFNGVMASPPGHPFLQHIISRLPETRDGSEVVDIAGPCMLTGRYLRYPDKTSIVVHPCQLFAPSDGQGEESPPYMNDTPASLTRHYWHGTWWKHKVRGWRYWRRLKVAFRRLRYRLTRGPILRPAEAKRQIDASVVNRSPPSGTRVAILVPVRDAIGDLDGFVKAISALDLPKRDTKLVFCEGDSVDGTFEKLEAIATGLRADYREVILLKKDLGTTLSRDQRQRRSIQRSRRGGLAAVRNHLIDFGLDETDDWALWIDVDVWLFPKDIFETLRGTGARIVTPNCVTWPGGPSFDLNSFVTIMEYPDAFYYKHIIGGVFQPPARARGRLHLDAVRHTDRIELDGVGGTMLLVDASLHRAGLRFPELPYKDLIETEAFGVLARDIGVRAVGLPNVEICHTPW